MGFMYMAYYAAFLPPGIFIFWGVQKVPTFLSCFSHPSSSAASCQKTHYNMSAISTHCFVRQRQFGERPSNVPMKYKTNALIHIDLFSAFFLETKTLLGLATFGISSNSIVQYRPPEYVRLQTSISP